MYDLKSMQECIDDCNRCRDECDNVLFTHCLDKGGRHLEPAHVRLMADCIEICQTAAKSMLRGSEIHSVICGACAEVCEACADSCEALGGEKMKACAEICRRCAQSCQEMSVGHAKEHSTSGKEGIIMA